VLALDESEAWRLPKNSRKLYQEVQAGKAAQEKQVSEYRKVELTDGREDVIKEEKEQKTILEYEDDEIPPWDIYRDEVKIKNWENTPNINVYYAYKQVFDNPQYYDQQTGRERWPKNDGFAGEPKEIVLQPGEEFDRYGYDSGNYVSPTGTSYRQRAVAPGTYLRPYSVFEVVKP